MMASLGAPLLHTSKSYHIDEIRQNLFRKLSQPLDQHPSAALSAPISCFISPCQPLDQQLSAACYAPVSSLISTCQQLYQHLSAS